MKIYSQTNFLFISVLFLINKFLFLSLIFNRLKRKSWTKWKIFVYFSEAFPMFYSLFPGISKIAINFFIYKYIIYNF
ncbi:MAG: hypothetical protein DWQ10_07785 [Calditrichaeota bacterium]|nr:MAG: hypothetical protein DWQ10_07785 [Calditrichota bacterium]